MVIELRGTVNENRLKEPGLTRLEIRRKRGDLLQIYKIMKGFERVEIDINTRGTGEEGRRHNKQIIKEKHLKGDDFLPNRHATTWNISPSEIAEADTVNQFKARLNKHMTSETWGRSVDRN